MTLKLLHTADWHLGRRFPSLDEADQHQLTRARLDAVRRLLDLAEQYAVDAVLCAGDVFDEPSPERVWWEGLRDCLLERSWSERSLYLLPGAHDPLLPKSIWTAGSPLRAGLPEWAHVVEREGATYDLGNDAVLCASPCTSHASGTDLAMRLPEREEGDERVRIGMVHGRSVHAGGDRTSFPVDPEAALRRGFDYLALGGLHDFRDVAPRQAPPSVYPGAPEPTAFGEPDAGGCAVVLFGRRGRRAVVRHEKVGRWTWRRETVRGLDSLRNLRDTEDLSRTVLHLAVDLEVPLREYEAVHGILAELKGTETARGRAGVLSTDTEGLKMDTTGVESLFQELPDTLRATAGKLAEAARGEHGETARRALWTLYRLVRREAAV